jgi:chromosome segregation ATPase
LSHVNGIVYEKDVPSLDELRAQLEAAVQEKQSKTARVDALMKEADDLRARATSAERKLAEVTQTLAEKEQQLEAATTRLAEATNRLASTEAVRKRLCWLMFAV